MLSKKLQTLLETFSKSQKIRFRKYLMSPFFNENEQLIILYDLLNSSTIELSKERIWTVIFPKKSYKDVELRRLSSDMTKLAEGFLVQEEVVKSKTLKNILTLTALKNKSLELHFKQAYNKINSHSETVEKSPEYYFGNFSIEMIHHEFEDLVNPQGNQLESLHVANHSLDHYYILTKLKFYFAYLNYKNAKPIESDFDLGDNFLVYVKEGSSFKEAIVQLYYEVIILLLDIENIGQFKLILKLLIDFENEIAIKELRSIYYCLQNYCALQLNKGNTSFFLDVFNIYKVMIEHNILPGEDSLKYQVYKNIITSGLIVKEFTWVENFIEDYTEKLSKEHRNNAKNYNLAKVYFHKGEYHDVIEQLREVEYKEQLYALGGKLMLLMTYFELKEIRPLDSLIDSFRIYLRRNKLISKNVRQQYMNLLRFTKKLTNIAPYDKKGLEKVKEQIENCKALAAKKWLLEKVAEMEK